MAGLKAHLRSNLVGYIAIFCSLSLGTAWAATGLTRNSVKSKHIAPGQVKRSDLARNAVNSPRVANGSLRAADFAAGQVPAGATGPTGPAGSPDTPAQVLDKIMQVDGSGSGLDSDQLDGRDSSGFGQVIYETALPWNPGSIAAGACLPMNFALPPEVLNTDHLVLTADIPIGTSLATQLTGFLYEPGESAYAVLCNHGTDANDPPAFNVNVLVLR